ncbi:MAG: preprotein translocase subunit TatA [Candidatus Fischerbacteria bacterium RBG_13_37_8]|uniref:Sec-independent protein translocase protein TatA n=1 Tax=Candidatus Fischerbacteria bacterium RBG_13_37_8 TaxID=1817863 RepID=A0A1F5VKA1_9BACT|nr:MAG: preprotein translocase subunit TatA [Candidatus Fischerbacteria bacterium RBG_13_37_8]
MLPHIGITELLLVLGIALLIFGASRLPDIGRGLGQGISNFRKSVKEASKKDTKSSSEEPSNKE